jgi:DNA-binding MarR family transcriptional regulator
MAADTADTDADLAVADQLTHQLAVLIRLLKRVSAGMSKAELEYLSGFPLLARLVTEGPGRSGELAAAMCADPSTISRQVAVLVKAGLVERRADPEDRRASLLAATDEGHRVLEHERRRRADQLAEALVAWTPESRAELSELLGRFVADLQKYEMGESR